MTNLDVYAEIDAILGPIKAAHPGISNGEVVKFLPEHLRQPFWERAVDRYLAAELAKLGDRPAGKDSPVATVELPDDCPNGLPVGLCGDDPDCRLAPCTSGGDADGATS